MLRNKIKHNCCQREKCYLIQRKLFLDTFCVNDWIYCQLRQTVCPLFHLCVIFSTQCFITTIIFALLVTAKSINAVLHYFENWGWPVFKHYGHFGMQMEKVASFNAFVCNVEFLCFSKLLFFCLKFTNYKTTK